MIQINKEKCTACGACVQKCPRSCISLSADKNGFLYPILNEELCVHCGLCDNVCPIGKETSRNPQQRAFACVNRNKEQLMAATSGGVFGALAHFILEKGGIVYGCAYTGHLQATHVRVDSVNKLAPLYGSKYVQSNTTDTFVLCETDLKAGREVLFSGTPCQIAGLKAFLGKNYDNLLTVDIVCHGVASQAYFDKFIELLEAKEGATCLDFSFRSKKNKGWSIAGVAEFFDNKKNKKITRNQFYFGNYYFFYYLGCSTYRESCYSCEYANLKRIADFTLGDFWGAEGLRLPFSVGNGCSLVLTNTEKAYELLKKLSMECEEVTIEQAVKYNHQLSEPSCARYNRDEILCQFREESADKIQRSFKRRYRKQILKSRIKYLVPQAVKQILQKIRYKA